LHLFGYGNRRSEDKVEIRYRMGLVRILWTQGIYGKFERQINITNFCARVTYLRRSSKCIARSQNWLKQVTRDSVIKLEHAKRSVQQSLEED